MKARTLLAAAVIAVALYPETAAARDLLDMGAGTEISGVARIGNKQVPLPGGKWEVVLSGTDRLGDVKSGNVFLVQKKSEALVGYLFVRTNLEPEGGWGWKRPNWCQRNNVHHNGSDNYYDTNNADCWIVNHWVVSNRVSRVDFLERIKDWLRKHNATSTMVGNRYWRNDSMDYILVTHAVNPAIWGFPYERRRAWTRSAWNAKSIVDGSPRQKFISTIKSFGEQYREAVGNGLRRRLAGASVPAFVYDAP